MSNNSLQRLLFQFYISSIKTATAYTDKYTYSGFQFYISSIKTVRKEYPIVLYDAFQFYISSIKT